jgi:O-methyltransferase domain
LSAPGTCADLQRVLAATKLPQVFDFGPHNRLLGIGGGTGSWSIATARRHQHITRAILELPTAADRVDAAGLRDRITVLTGDGTAGELPGGYDVFLLANLIHDWSAEQNQELLQRVRRAARPASADAVPRSQDCSEMICYGVYAAWEYRRLRRRWASCGLMLFTESPCGRGLANRP